MINAKKTPTYTLNCYAMIIYTIKPYIHSYTVCLGVTRPQGQFSSGLGYVAGGDVFHGGCFLPRGGVFDSGSFAFRRAAGAVAADDAALPRFGNAGRRRHPDILLDFTFVFIQRTVQVFFTLTLHFV